MPDFKQYFDEELRYLMEAGKEFAKEFPDKAGYLNLAATDDRDPYVERLLEGFAFLTGRIREKMDDDFPEITENILETVAPDFLRPVPSLSLVQFQPRPGMLQQNYTLPRGTFVLSNPVGENLTTCRFQTTQEVVVHPINLSSVEQVSHPARGDGLKFSFHLEEGTDLNSFPFSSTAIVASAGYSTICSRRKSVRSSWKRMRVKSKLLATGSRFLKPEDSISMRRCCPK
jgi:type VI secretion system protein ImpG